MDTVVHFISSNLLDAWHTLSPTQWAWTALLFVWTGFVRAAFGFGGAALGLPVLFFVVDDPLFWLPIIGQHLLLFSFITIGKRWHQVDWRFLWYSLAVMAIPAFIGIAGLIAFPKVIMLTFIYSVVTVYGFLWVLNVQIKSRPSVNTLFLVAGGYVAGVSLSGAPLIVPVYMQNVKTYLLRNSLFVLWIIFVSLKMATFVAFDVAMNYTMALLLLPFVATGHTLGSLVHYKMQAKGELVKRAMGGALLLVCVAGFTNIALS